MLFTILKNTKPHSSPSEIFKKLEEGTKFRCEDSDYQFCIFYFGDVKGISIKYSEYQYFFLNTFSPDYITEFKGYYSELTGEKIDRIRFCFNAFKSIIADKRFRIIELEALINDPTCEEMLISGADLENNDEFRSIIRDGQIKKIILYFQNLSPNEEGFIVKIFSEGKLSIIPDFDFSYLNVLSLYLLGLLICE